MVGSNKRPRTGEMTLKLDRKITRILYDYASDEQADLGSPTIFPSIGALVEYVREVDMELRRRNIAQIENSIQRVLPKIKQQQEARANTGVSEAQVSDEEPEMDRTAQFSGIETVPTIDTNAMNGSLMRLWGTKPAESERQNSENAHCQKAEPIGQNSSENKREKNVRKKKRANTATVPEVRLSDLGGVDACIEEILESIVLPLKHPEIYTHTGVQPPRGILLHGPPGCGKTLLANAIAGEVGVPFLQISAPSIVSGMSGESEKKLREVFEEARELAPCLVFIDEIDSITPKRENAQREMERRIVAQMLTCIDSLSWEKASSPVMLIGATNRPDSLDPALRRAGRFDREIAMTVPDEAARMQILSVLCRPLRLSGEFDFEELAKRTPGYVGADLTALVTTAGMIAVKRILHTLNPLSVADSDSSGLTSRLAESTVLDCDGPSSMNVDSTPVDKANTPGHCDPIPTTQAIAQFLASHPEPLTPDELAPAAITNSDFIQALAKVQPSAKREGFATVPGVTWDDIGALAKVREELRMAVVEPIRNPEIFAQVGITAPAGVLLWGPPGNGKTLLAKAIANESHTNFISVKGGELMSKYVGDSERAVRQVFARARASSPCVIFFDELDALCSRRGGEQSEASARVVNTLLTEVDGMEARKRVYVIAATNRPDIIDPAMLRPGRLDKLLYVDLPSAPERAEILRTLSKKTPLGPDVDLKEIACDRRCEGFSGADLSGLVRSASEAALRSVLFGPEALPTSSSLSASERPSIVVLRAHFDMALQRTTPSVSASDMKRYESLRRLYGN
ncbi:Ribosome biogenesis ATPase rix7 [Coemansia brasiliensis]|uniref:Ribosome biogenesis ATPase rix7 n=1 Tax=Coemansia brasiliensis TaxID=2650707 RepID=A0A9W8IF00_9FUNG|nr:Ribosome biogenesis ATPase rix7 [Coemansia brasiliensis]